MLLDSARQKILFEIGEIDKLTKSYLPLLDLVQRRDPDLVEKAALAQVLHSFYNGIENIFVVIGKITDG